MKSVFVFVAGEFLKRISYRSKTAALQNYKHFKKHGIIDYNTGEKIEGATFELFY